jgi:hypothetical protein
MADHFIEIIGAYLEISAFGAYPSLEGNNAFSRSFINGISLSINTFSTTSKPSTGPEKFIMPEI